MMSGGMKDSKFMLHAVAFFLTVVGALNWGLIGLFNFNLVHELAMFVPGLERVVYILVGVAAVYLVAMHQEDCKTCQMMMMPEAKSKSKRR